MQALGTHSDCAPNGPFGACRDLRAGNAVGSGRTYSHASTSSGTCEQAHAGLLRSVSRECLRREPGEQDQISRDVSSRARLALCGRLICLGYLPRGVGVTLQQCGDLVRPMTSASVTGGTDATASACARSGPELGSAQPIEFEAPRALRSLLGMHGNLSWHLNPSCDKEKTRDGPRPACRDRTRVPCCRPCEKTPPTRQGLGHSCGRQQLL